MKTAFIIMVITNILSIALVVYYSNKPAKVIEKEVLLHEVPVGNGLIRVEDDKGQLRYLKADSTVLFIPTTPQINRHD